MNDDLNEDPDFDIDDGHKYSDTEEVEVKQGGGWIRYLEFSIRCATQKCQGICFKGLATKKQKKPVY